MNEENRVEEIKKSGNKRPLIYTLLFVVCLGTCAGLYFLHGIKDPRVLLQTGVLLMLSAIVTIFSFNAQAVYDKLFGDNINHYVRFYIALMIVMAGCMIIPFMPAAAWPIVAVFCLLTILSNIPTGIVSSAMCLYILAIAGGAGSYPYVFVYLMTGICASIIVANIDENFKTTLPVLNIELLLLAGLSVTIITTSSSVSVELFIYPIVNVTVTLIFMLFFLKLYSARVIFKQKDDYLELNDPECVILTKLKDHSPEDYRKTVHVVYFCDRVCAAIGLRPDVVKCAGLYHRIGVIGGEYNWENTKTACVEASLPDEVMQILEEFENDAVPMTKAETAVLYMCECVVSSVQYLFAKNPEINLDYPSLVDAIFKQRLESGIFDQNEISIRQLELMKKVFEAEKLYYDFLR